MKEVYKITGMTCQSCVNHLEHEINKISQVSKVEVNLLAKTLTIENNGVSKDDIIMHIRKAGYDVEGETANKESKKGSKISLIINIILLIILMFLAMGEMIGIPLPKYISQYDYPLVNSLLQLLLTIVIMYNHKDSIITGLKRLFKSPSMESLITVGSFSALIYGIIIIIILMIGYTDNNMELVHKYSHSLYLESAASILVIVRLGKFIEERTKGRATKELERIESLMPQYATIREDELEVLKPIEMVNIDDISIVKKGEAIPCDGVIIKGEGLINKANLTGEAIPVDVKENDNVLASSYLVNGYLEIKVLKRSNESNISQIIDLVNEASVSKANISKLVDKISKFFVPTVFIISLITFITNFIISKDLSLSLNFMISILVIACPCALGLATPVAIMVSTLKAAKTNILFKNVDILEKAKSIDTVVFDKTGTLTNNELIVKNISDNKYLDIIYSLEAMTNHPLANSICNYAKTYNSKRLEVTNFSETNGMGILGVVNNHKYYFGNYNYVKSILNIDLENDNLLLNLYLFDDEKVYVTLSLDDDIKSSAYKLINKLKADNIKVVLLTGDNKVRASYLKEELKMDKVYAEVLPIDKGNIIKEIKAEGNSVAFVGDGVNDALALSIADIGIAVNNATDIATDSSDVILLDDDIINIYNVIKLSKRTFLTIKANLFWAFIYNIIGVFIASGLFYYSYNLKLTPMLGSLFMCLSSVFVVTNALTINLTKFVKGGAQMIINIEGMMCKHCQKSVEDAISSVSGVVSFEVNLKKKCAKVLMDYNNYEAVCEAINAKGYKATLAK